MKKMYAILVFSIFVLLFWYSMAAWMVYQISKDLGVWTYIMVWINKWIQWRYGWIK